ncbi:MAG: hypothetical protein RR054_06630, partial [Clostridia bacterium]
MLKLILLAESGINISMFKRFISFIHRYKNNNEIYFSQCQEEITLANVLLLKHLSVITIIMLGIYF